MSDQAFIRGRQSPNIEDRRGEYSDLEHLLMATGLMQPPMQDAELRKQMNLEPGAWLDYEDPNRPLPISPLLIEAGGNDLDNQYAHRLMVGQGADLPTRRIGRMDEPLSRKDRR